MVALMSPDLKVQMRFCSTGSKLEAVLVDNQSYRIRAPIIGSFRNYFYWYQLTGNQISREKSFFFLPCHLFPRAAGRSSIRQWGGVLRRPMGLQNGQPFRRDTKKDCFFLPARGGLGHLRCHPETVQRATEDLPAGPRPPTHCHHHFSLP